MRDVNKKDDCEQENIQRIILHLFTEIDRICVKYRLRYYAIGGTCLGAVRHGGFIPWDDDLDIAMPREDYEYFKKVAVRELPEYIEIFTESQGKHFTCYFMQLHHAGTSCIGKGLLKYPDRYMGVHVDIMPLDGIPKGQKEQRKYFFELKTIARMDYTRKYALDEELNQKRPKGKVVLGKMIYQFIKRLPDNYFSDKYVQLQKKYSYDDSKDLCYTWSKRASQVIFPKSDFKDYVLLPFEDTQMRCPVGYDNFLTVLFGDYMKLPPEEERVPCHETDIIDLERPYTYYIKEEG